MEATMNGKGTVQQDGDARVLRFERRIDHPVGDVWQAISTPDGIRGWLGATQIDLKPGGGVRLQFDKTAGNVVEGKVTEVDPPRVLEYTFGQDDSILRWELTPAGDGATTLVLTHRLPAGAGHLPETLAGWHTLLDLIPAAIAGEDPQWSKERRDEVRKGYGPVQVPA
jgi:uncharacterized protein YndB with AHSA1/START domain